MKRDFSQVANKEFDLIIIGGGIFALFAAWDAVLRGLSVALFERNDFNSGSSSQHFKMAHGGIRYIQHGDIYRIRESVKERRALLKIAPHLVDPLPIVIPTYGHGKKGKEFLSIGMFLYDLFALDRNKGIKDPKQKIPFCTTFSKAKTLELFPDLHQDGLTGAAFFYDGQVYNTPRLGLSVLKSALSKGLKAYNYCEVVKILKEGNEVKGVLVKDAFTTHQFEVSSKVVLNAAGPSAHWLLEESLGIELKPKPKFSRDTCFLVKRRFSHPYGLAVMGQTKDPDSLLSRPSRHLFVIPWRQYSLIGVWHRVFDCKPEDVTVTENEIQSFIDEINGGYPELKLKLDEVSIVNYGQVLFGQEQKGGEDLSYGKRSLIIDHLKDHGVANLVSLIGVRATTARGESVHAIDLIQQKLGKKKVLAPTDILPVWGGDVENFGLLCQEAHADFKEHVPDHVRLAVLKNYGTQYREVLGSDVLQEYFEGTNVLKGEVLHAIRQEWVCHLSDVVFRRTELASGGNPGEQVLTECADILASELGWSLEDKRKEIEACRQIFSIEGAVE